jgi:hypothetical protein
MQRLQKKPDNTPAVFINGNSSETGGEIALRRAFGAAETEYHWVLSTYYKYYFKNKFILAI